MVLGITITTILIAAYAADHPRFRNGLIKIVAGTLAVMLIVYGLCALQNAARAEDAHSTTIKIDNYLVNPDIADGELCLKISFVYQGQWLSFWWDEEDLDTSRTLYVEIWDKVECIDAYYAKK